MRLSEIREASESNQGYCLKCKEWTHDCCEPDAHKYECPECNCNSVYGAEELVLCGLVNIDDDDDDDLYDDDDDDFYNDFIDPDLEDDGDKF